MSSKSKSDTLAESIVITSIVGEHTETANKLVSHGIESVNFQSEEELSQVIFLTDNMCQYAEETTETNTSVKNHYISLEDIPERIDTLQDISINTCMQTRIEPKLSVLNTTKNDPANVCQICDKTFKTTSNLNVHVRIHCSERKFVCNTCKKSYKYSTQLINHKRLHTGEKPFGCYHKSCEKTFAQLGQLTKHVRVHTGESPYECKVCLKRFKRGYHLRTHLKLHTKSALHVCDLCGKSYTQAPQLRIHMRTHSTTKDFNCTVCQKSFHKVSVRNKHMQIHLKNLGK